MTNVVAEQQSQKKSIIVEDGAQLQNFEIKPINTMKVINTFS
ncbi:MAG: hypothetical protein R2836_06885 [Chitinophagales bacterium]